MMGGRGEGDNDDMCLPPHVSTDDNNAPTILCPQLMTHVHHPPPERRVLFYFIYANVYYCSVWINYMYDFYFWNANVDNALSKNIVYSEVLLN